jgi:hypothetical protein
VLLQELAASEIGPSNTKDITQCTKSTNACVKMHKISKINAASALKKHNIFTTRSFSSSSSSTNTTQLDITQDELNKARFVRFFAAIFMLTAGIRVAPNAAASTVDHTVKLLDAEERMLVSAGLSRLNMLLRMDAVKRRAVECGALPRLLGLVDSVNADKAAADILKDDTIGMLLIMKPAHSVLST